MRRRRREAEARLAAEQAARKDLARRLKAYEDMHRWMVDHAPATLRRYPGEMPEWRWTPMEVLDRALREDYASALRAQINQADTLFHEWVEHGGEG